MDFKPDRIESLIDDLITELSVKVSDIPLEKIKDKYIPLLNKLRESMIDATEGEDEEVSKQKTMEIEKVEVNEIEAKAFHKIQQSEKKSEEYINNLTPTIDNLENIEKKTMIQHKKEYNLKNALVGSNYSFDLVEIGIDDIIIEKILPNGDNNSDENYSLEELGLSYSKNNSAITGKPNKAGDFTFKIEYTTDPPVDPSEPTIYEDRLLRLIVIPDPKSLWQTKEPEAGSPYFKEHFKFKKLSHHNFTIYGGSLRGRSHAHSGTFRDDDFLIQRLNKDSLLLVVADGAGSAKYSREGSRIASATCLNSISKDLENLGDDFIKDLINLRDTDPTPELQVNLNSKIHNIIGTAVQSARKSISKKAAEDGYEVKDFSTTLLFTIAIKINYGYCLISYGVGDGIIAYVNEEFPKLLTKPDGGEFAGQTRFLTMQDSIESLSNRISISFVDKLTDLFLMTDGISDPFFETDANFEKANKWLHLKNEITQNLDFEAENISSEFKNWLGFWSPGNHDDRTIIFVK